jgi:methyl-accepting chemotaxis protein
MAKKNKRQKSHPNDIPPAEATAEATEVSEETAEAAEEVAEASEETAEAAEEVAEAGEETADLEKRPPLPSQEAAQSDAA